MTDGARSGGFLSAAPTSLRGMCGTAPTFPVTGFGYGELTEAYEREYTDSIDAQVFAPNGHLLADLPTPRLAGPDVPGGGAIMRPVLAKILADATRAAGVTVQAACAGVAVRIARPKPSAAPASRRPRDKFVMLWSPLSLGTPGMVRTYYRAETA